MTTTPTPECELIDHSEGTGRQDYHVTRIYRLNGQDTVRVTVRRDSYQDQSHAFAEIFTPARTWTTLIADPASNWHPKTAVVADFSALVKVADGLIKRVARIIAK